MELARDQYREIIKTAATYNIGALTVVISLLCIYFVYVLVYGFVFCTTRHLPGPFLTRFSKASYYALLFGGSISADVHELHKKYGPVLRLAPKMVDVQLPEATLQGWGGQNETKLPWNKDPDFCHLLRSGMKVDNIISIAGPREALRMRRLMGMPFAKKFLLEQEHIFKRCTKKVIDNLDRLCAIQDGKVDVAHQFMKYSFDLLTEFAYGGYFKGAAIRPGVSEIQLISQVPLSNAFAAAFPTIFKILTYIPWKKVEWTRSRDEFVQICDKSIREYKENVKPGSRKDSLSALIASRDDDGSGLSHEELVGAATILLVAGVDTTAIALTYISYELAKHPEYIERLAEEVSHYKDIDKLQSIELEKLPLLNAVIREVLRLYPPVPAPIGRVSPPGGTILGGYRIPGGIIVCREAWAACRDPNLYPDPDSFKPERWLGLSRDDENRLWDQAMIFSYGPRICLGKEMALLELRILLSALVMKYSWTGIPDTAGNWDEEMKPFDTGVIHPWNGKCILKLEPRI